VRAGRGKKNEEKGENVEASGRRMTLAKKRQKNRYANAPQEKNRGEGETKKTEEEDNKKKSTSKRQAKQKASRVGEKERIVWRTHCLHP